MTLTEAASSETSDRSSTSSMRMVLVLAGLGAAAIHFGFAPSHLEESTSHGVFFLTVAWLQVAGALAAGWRPGRAAYLAAAALNAGVIAVWVLARTAGISGDVEAFGFADILATSLEGIVVIGSLAAAGHRLPAWSPSPGRAAAPFGISAVAVAALVSASMAPSLSGHDHDEAGHGSAPEAAAHDHGDTSHGDRAHDMAGMDMGEQPVVVAYDPEKPVDLGGTPGVTAKQQAEAENLVGATLLGLPQWSDSAVAEADGFHSIGDGATGTEHLVNTTYMQDDVFFDPDRPESLVYETGTGKRVLAAAMYMVKPGTPLTDVPKLGGKLIQWHTHGNLCYGANGRLAGLTDENGDCRQGTVKPVETPMIHVWIRANECGPFAALEGIGAGKIAEGETRLCDHEHGG